MRRSGDEFNQDNGEEAAETLDLGRALSARHRGFPAIHRLAATVSLARRAAEFGAGRLPLLSRLQRHWSRSEDGQRWFSPIYAWPVDAMARSAPATPPSPAAWESRKSDAGVKVVQATSFPTTLPAPAGSVLRRPEAAPSPAADASGPLKNAPETQGPERQKRVRPARHAAKPAGVAAKPASRADLTQALDPNRSLSSAPSPPQVQRAGGQATEGRLASSSSSPISSSAGDKVEITIPPAPSLPRVHVGTPIVRRRIGVPPQRTGNASQKEGNAGRPESRVIAPSSAPATDPTIPSEKPQLSAVTPGDLRSAAGANRPEGSRSHSIARTSSISGPPNEPISSAGLPPSVAVPRVQLGSAIVKRHIGIPKSRLDAGAQSLSRSVVSGPAPAGPIAAPIGGPDTGLPARAESIETRIAARSSVVSADPSGVVSVGAVPPEPVPNAEPVSPEGPVVQAESPLPSLLRGSELGSAVFRRHSGAPQEASANPTVTVPTFEAGTVKPSAAPPTGGVSGEEPVSAPDRQDPAGPPAVRVHRKAEPESSARGAEAGHLDDVHHIRQPGHEAGRTASPVVRVETSPAPELLRRATTRGEVSPGVLRTDNQSLPFQLETTGQTLVMPLPHDAEEGSGSVTSGGRPLSSTGHALAVDRSDASVSHLERARAAEPDGGVERIHRSPVAPAGAERGSEQTNGGTERSSAGPLMPEDQSPAREDAISRTPSLVAQALPVQTAQEPKASATVRESVPALPSPDVLTHLDKSGKLDPAMPGALHRTLLTGTTAPPRDFTHNFALDIIRRHEAVAIMRPVEYRDLRSNSAPSGSFVRRAQMTVSPSALGANGSIEAPAHRQNPVVSPESRIFSEEVPSTSAIPAPMGVNTSAGAVTSAQQGPVGADSVARQFDGDSPSITAGETPASSAPLGPDQPPIVVHRHLDVMNPAMTPHHSASEPATRQRDPAPGGTPIQPDTRSAGPGTSTLFRAADAGRERFVVAAANAGSNLSAGFVQRMTASLERTPAEASFPRGSRLNAARAGHVPGVFPVALNRIPGATPASSVARFAADKLGAVGSRGAWPALLQSRLTAQTSSLGRQGGVLSGLARPVFRSFKTGGLAGGGGSNDALMINRLPNVTGMPGFPAGSTTGFHSMPGPAPGVSAVPLRHIGASGSPIHALQRQAQGASAPAPGPSAVTTNASPAIPPPVAPRQNAAPDVKRLADQVYRMIVQRVATERDRRGL
jgi:hypothetical protein